MRRSLIRLLWIALYLGLLDVTASIVFRYPDDPVKTPPSRFQQYFEYGRSVEGKLAKMKSEMVNWGWVDATRYRSLPTESDHPNQLLLAVYGMSHAKRLGEAIPEVTDRYVVRMVNAPGATPNWALAAFKGDVNRHRAVAAVLGIMTHGVPFVTSTSGATMHFDMCYPYSYPRYVLTGDALTAVWPPFSSAEGFVDTLSDPGKWKDYCSWLIANDEYYDPFLFHRSFLDSSTICRCLRRAYATKTRRRKVDLVYNQHGFNTGAEEVAVLKRIVEEFAATARKHEMIPLVYVVNNRGCSNHLLQVLQPVLNAGRIPYLSTHEICPPDDPRVFLSGGDGHFIHSKDLELGAALISLIEDEISIRAGTTGTNCQKTAIVALHGVGCSKDMSMQEMNGQAQ